MNSKKMSILIFIVTSILLLPNINILAKAGSKENPYTTNEKIDKKEMAAKVKAEFINAWDGYKKYAWGHDELKPVSKTYFDWYGTSLLMTPVDAFDTMVLMGLKKEADETKRLIFEKLSFDKNISVKFFEINIRLEGGLLSGYELTHDKRFLKLAEDLANRLLPVFNTKTGMPYRYVNLKTGEVKGEVSNPAEIGSCLIEFGTLSKLTDNPIYYDKAKKALVELYNHRSKIGLVGSSINVETGKWIDSESHISGGIDSYYEYLLKSWKLFGDKDCKRMWKESIKAVNKYLADSASTGFWYRQVNMNTGKRTSTLFGSLDAFFGAELALSGDINKAEALQASCYKMWNLTGIEPEEINYDSMKIISPQYVLRPENIESAYYLYHYTHNEKYLQMGRTYFDSIVKYCRTNDGYSGLKSVITKEKDDEMHSFFLAETLKYLYLMFASSNTLNFNSVIFNTEAHALKRFN